MPIDKPFAQSCENNKQPILDILQEAFRPCSRVLEIGSGTGQHAVFFARQMPWLHWQPSELPENLPGIRRWINDEQLADVIPEPLVLDVAAQVWPGLTVDAVFTANTLHIMGWPLVRQCFARVGALLPVAGRFCVYGPFNYGGSFTSPSNARFDAWLRQRDARSGIRDFEAVCTEAAEQGLVLEADHAMPANNRILVFQRR